MIILEGVDCSGKTTLMTNLDNRFTVKNSHYSAHDEQAMLEHAEMALPGSKEVVDRFHLSEIPYSMYYRHEPPRYESVAKIDLALRDGENLVIVCCPPWPDVKLEWEKRRDEELIQNVHALHSIYMWYRDKAQAFTTLQVWKYDYTATDFDSLTSALIAWETDYV